MPGYPVTCRSITGSGNTQPSAADPLSSGSTSCSADQRGETQHLGMRTAEKLLTRDRLNGRAS